MVGGIMYLKVENILNKITSLSNFENSLGLET